MGGEQGQVSLYLPLSPTFLCSIAVQQETKGQLNTAETSMKDYNAECVKGWTCGPFERCTYVKVSAFPLAASGTHRPSR